MLWKCPDITNYVFILPSNYPALGYDIRPAQFACTQSSPAGGGGITSRDPLWLAFLHAMVTRLNTFTVFPKKKSVGHVPFGHTYVVTSRENLQSFKICYSRSALAESKLFS